MAFKDFAKGFGGFFGAFSPSRVIASARAVEGKLYKVKRTDPIQSTVGAPGAQPSRLPVVDLDVGAAHFDPGVAPVLSPDWNRRPGTQPATLLPDAPFNDVVARKPPTLAPPVANVIERPIAIVAPVESGAVAPPAQTAPVAAPVVAVAAPVVQSVGARLPTFVNGELIF